VMGEGNRIEMDQLEQLQSRLRELEAEKEHWQRDKIITVQTIKSVEPPNYQMDMKRLKKLELDCKKLETIIKYGNISTVSSIIDDYKSVSKKLLEQLTRELQFYLASAEEREDLLDFLAYLRYTEQELKKFLLTEEAPSEKGEAYEKS